MKFVCHHCRSKYSINDDLIRNKRFKIRCKVCKNIIEVKGPVQEKKAEARESWSPHHIASHAGARTRLGVEEDRAATSLRKKSAPVIVHRPSLAPTWGLKWNEADLVRWFIAINGTTMGPITARQVWEYRRLGRINDDSWVWREGMTDWIPFRSCKELMALLDAAIRAMTDPPPPSENPTVRKPQPSLHAVPSPDLSHPKVDISSGPSTSEDLFSEDTNSAIDSGVLSTPSKTGRLYLYLASGFFITAAVVLGIVLFDEPEPRVVEKVKVVYKDRLVEKEIDKTGETVEDEVDTGMRLSGNARKRRSFRPKKPSKEKTQALMAQLGVATPRNGAPVGGIAGAPRTEKRDKDRPGGGLSAHQVKVVVNTHKRELKMCYERSLKNGEASSKEDINVKFKITVGASGAVRKIALGGGAGKMPMMRKCLTRNVQTWIFPSQAEESRLEFPFIFTPR